MISNLEERIEKLIRIGIALSSERNINRLLEMIVDSARDLTAADAGTLYIVQPEEKSLKFEILQNDTLNTRQGGASGNPVTLPPIPLEKDGLPNHSAVAAYVATTGLSVNIPDVYEAEGFDFTGPRRFDAMTGYRSKSMLVLPMRNHEDDIIGVLALLNAMDADSDQVIAFSPEFESLTSALASQAAVAITNVRLIQGLQDLFNAMILSIASAIDEKSPYTGGHVRRVAELTLRMAEVVGEVDHGPYADFHLTPDQLEELRVAAWLHDVGKVTTPEYVVDKATKLETIFDRVALVEARYDAITESLRREAAEKKLALLARGAGDQSGLEEIDLELESRLKEADEELQFLITTNKGGEFMADDKIARLKAIAARTYWAGNEEKPYLSENEVMNLSIKKGTLTAEERGKIEAHATMTMKMLSELPFPKKLKRVPEFAAGHHEKLNGKGYPLGLTADKISPQARMMAIADIFEALTASDRPYKPAKKLSECIKILKFFVKDQEVDGDLVDIFLSSGLVRDYAKRELKPAQVDIDLDSPPAT